MGYDLANWARNVDHPTLTPRVRQVLVAICTVAHDDHGEFWMRGKRLLAEYIPDMSYGSYRNCIASLVKADLLIKIGHGGGRTGYGRGTGNRYRVNSSAVRNRQPAQGVLPDIQRAPVALSSDDVTVPDQETVRASALHQKLDELLATGVSPDQVLALLQFVSETLDALPANSSANEETNHEQVMNRSVNMTSSGETSHEQVMENDEFPMHPASPNVKTRHEQVMLHDINRTNRSADMTSLQYVEEKLGEDNRENNAAAAAIHIEDSMTSFFEQLTATLRDAGYHGIWATQFADLSGLIKDYEGVTGSAPDQRTADYIVGRLRDSKGVRNVAGFVRTLTEDVLRTGEGFVPADDFPAPPYSAPPTHPDELDWEVLHLAHQEQASPASGVWAKVLESLRTQVARPAFETWLSESRGVAYVGGTFVVGTPNRFAVEMLEQRLHPVIERAVRDAVGEQPEILYTVDAQVGEGCPICAGAGDRSAAAS